MCMGTSTPKLQIPSSPLLVFNWKNNSSNKTLELATLEEDQARHQFFRESRLFI
jgi:hypothetical protein